MRIKPKPDDAAIASNQTFYPRGRTGREMYRVGRRAHDLEVRP